MFYVNMKNMFAQLPTDSLQHFPYYYVYYFHVKYRIQSTAKICYTDKSVEQLGNSRSFNFGKNSSCCMFYLKLRLLKPTSSQQLT